MLGGTSIEPAISTTGQSGDLFESRLRFGFAPLLEEEHGYTQQAECSCTLAELVYVLLHAIANIDDGVDPVLLGFSSRMCKHFADLRISPLTRDLRHEAGEAFGIT